MKRAKKITLKNAVPLDDYEMKVIFGGGSGSLSSGYTGECGGSGFLRSYKCWNEYGDGGDSYVCAESISDGEKIYYSDICYRYPGVGIYDKVCDLIIRNVRVYCEPYNKPTIIEGGDSGSGY